MGLDLDWPAQIIGWTVVWVAAGMAAREALQQREERDHREGGHVAHEERR